MQLRPVGLGNQHTRRLLELRDARAYQIEQQHLNRRTKSSTARYLADPSHEQSPRDERTIEAVLDARTDERALGNVSTAHRLREKIQRSRNGIQTERSERGHQDPISPLLTALDDPKSRPTAKTKAKRDMDVVAATKRRIVAVRRRGNGENNGNAVMPRRRASKHELEWFEKHEQFSQRIAVVEKECQTWWQSFYAAASRAQGVDNHQTSVTAINKMFEESGAACRQETHRIHQQLTMLRSKVRMVSEKVEHMRNGSRFYAKLQELIEDVEESLAAFRLAQRERYDEYVAEEKTLEKELAAFQEKMEEWTQTVETLEQAKRPARRPSVSYQKVNKLSQPESASQLSPENEDEGFDDTIASDMAMMERVRCLNELILQSGGMRGGWDEREHGTFTSLLLKYGLSESALLQNVADQSPRSQNNQREEMTDNNLDYEAAVARFLCKCTKQIVTQSGKAVRDHLNWYVHHIELVQKKKDVIRQWRARKETDRLISIQQGLETVAPGDDEANDGIDDEGEQRKLLAEAKAKKKKQAQLRVWREEKERREQERLKNEQDAQQQREEREAKRKQEKLSDKQKILVYKLRKEQEAAMMQAASKSRSPQQQSPLPTSSSSLREDLAERSKAAIESAKAKRVALQDLEAKKRKQQELPPRPKSSLTSPASTPPIEHSEARAAKLLNATKASEARGLSKMELRKRENERRHQSAHDTYIPGATAIPDVKVKSFGHIPIQPRAIPSWRRNM